MSLDRFTKHLCFNCPVKCKFGKQTKEIIIGCKKLDKFKRDNNQSDK